MTSGQAPYAVVGPRRDHDYGLVTDSGLRRRVLVDGFPVGPAAGRL